ncbi:hypothetical protein [Glutamicibacter sp. TV12E]|uniref:hypothetical protein n=1 Tax=Glutamicibacter sp. TV12E TaxID=3446362 RepID=UPI004033E16F
MMRAPVWATPLPAAIDSLGKASEALELLFGEGLTFGQSGQYLIVYTPGEACGCLACNRDVYRVRAVAGEDSMFEHDQMMFLCPDCGDKNCSQAKNHRQLCDKDAEELLAPKELRPGVSATTTPEAIERLESNYGEDD